MITHSALPKKPVGQRTKEVHYAHARNHFQRRRSFKKKKKEEEVEKEKERNESFPQCDVSVSGCVC